MKPLNTIFGKASVWRCQSYRLIGLYIQLCCIPKSLWLGSICVQINSKLKSKPYDYLINFSICSAKWRVLLYSWKSFNLLSKWLVLLTVLTIKGYPGKPFDRDITSCHNLKFCSVTTIFCHWILISMSRFRKPWWCVY